MSVYLDELRSRLNAYVNNSQSYDKREGLQEHISTYSYPFATTLEAFITLFIQLISDGSYIEACFLMHAAQTIPGVGKIEVTINDTEFTFQQSCAAYPRFWTATNNYNFAENDNLIARAQEFKQFISPIQSLSTKSSSLTEDDFLKVLTVVMAGNQLSIVKKILDYKLINNSEAIQNIIEQFAEVFITNLSARVLDNIICAQFYIFKHLLSYKQLLLEFQKNIAKKVALALNEATYLGFASGLEEFYRDEKIAAKFLNDIRHENITVIDSMLAAGISLAISDIAGRGPVYYAVGEVQSDTVCQKLLQHDPTIAAVELAAHPEIIKKVIKKNWFSVTLKLLDDIPEQIKNEPSAQDVFRDASAYAIEWSQVAIVEKFIATGLIQDTVYLEQAMRQAFAELKKQTISGENTENAFQVLKIFLNCNTINIKAKQELAQEIFEVISSNECEQEPALYLIASQINDVEDLARAIKTYNKADESLKLMLLYNIQTYIEANSLSLDDMYKPRDNRRNNILHLAIIYNFPRVVAWFLDNERELISNLIETIDKIKDPKEKVKAFKPVLRETFFSPFMRNCKEKTPMQLAVENKNIIIVQLLLRQEQLINRLIIIAKKFLEERDESDKSLIECYVYLSNIIGFAVDDKNIAIEITGLDPASEFYIEFFNWVIIAPTRSIDYAGLMPRPLDMIIQQCILSNNWSEFNRWNRKNNIATCQEDLDVIAYWFLKSIDMPNGDAYEQLKKIVELNREFLPKSPILLTGLWQLALGIPRKPIEHFQYVINLVAPLNANAVLKQEESPLDDTNIDFFYRLLSSLLFESYFDAAELIIQRYPDMYKCKIIAEEYVVENALSFARNAYNEKTYNSYIQGLVKFFLSSEASKKFFINTLAYLIQDGKMQLVIKLAAAETPSSNIKWSKSKQLKVFCPQILQLSQQYNIPEVAQALWAEEQQFFDSTSHARIARAMYFSLHTKNGCFFEEVLNDLKDIDRSLKSYIDGVMSQLLPSFSDDSIAIFNNINTKYNLEFHTSANLQYALVHAVDKDPALLSILLKLNVSLNLSSYIRVDIEFFNKCVKENLFLDSIEVETGNTILHKLISVYAGCTKISNPRLNNIKAYLAKVGSKYLATKNAQGKTPIMLLLADINAGREELLQTFLECTPPNPADIGSYEQWQRLLYDVVSAGNFKVAQVLLAAGVPPTYIDEQGNTILHKAVTINGAKDDDIRMLLSYYPNIFHKNRRGRTAYETRANHGSTFARIINAASPILRLLDATQNEAKPFANFSRDENHGNDLHADGGNALHGAVRANNPALVIELLKRGVDPQELNKNKWTPIRLAAKLGHWDCLEAFIPAVLKSEHEKDIYGEVLSWAVIGQQLKLVELLIQRGVNINWHPKGAEISMPILHRAVLSQNEEIINLLLLQPNIDLLAIGPGDDTAYTLAKSLNIETDGWQAIVEKLNPYKITVDESKAVRQLADLGDSAVGTHQNESSSSYSNPVLSLAMDSPEAMLLLPDLLKKYKNSPWEARDNIKQCIIAYASNSDASHFIRYVKNDERIDEAVLIEADSQLIQEIFLAIPDKEESSKVKDFYSNHIYSLIKRGAFDKAKRLIDGFGAPNYKDVDANKTTLQLLIETHQIISVQYRASPLNSFYGIDLHILQESIRTFLRHHSDAELADNTQFVEHPLATIVESALLKVFIEMHTPNVANPVSYSLWKKHLYDLVFNKDFETAEILLEAGVPPTYIGEMTDNILHRALMDPHISIENIKMLLSYYPDIFQTDVDDQTPCAMRPKQKSIIGFSSFFNGSSSSFAINDLLDLTSKTLFANFPRTAKEEKSLHGDGGNALHGAVRANNPALLTALLATGKLDINARDNHGRSPIRLAADLAHWECVELLLPEKLETAHDKNIYGEVLSWIINAKQLNLIDKLIRLDVNVNWRPADDKDFMPILHSAVKTQHEGIINLLLSLTQPDLLATDNEGKTAYEFAKSLNIETDTWEALIERLNPLNQPVNADNDDSAEDATPLTDMQPMQQEVRAEVAQCSGYEPTFFDSKSEPEDSASSGATEKVQPPKPARVMKMRPVNPELLGGLWQPGAESIESRVGISLDN
jgi:ankyrin repeat protein